MDTDSQGNELITDAETELQKAVESSTNTDSNTKVERIMSLENMINGYMVDLKKLQDTLKDQSGMLKGTYENDAEYAGVVEKAKDVQKMKQTIKERLMKDPSVSLLEAKVNDLKQEVKDVRQALSDYLQQYYQESGLTQITGADGEVHDIVATVRLVKKRDS